MMWKHLWIIAAIIPLLLIPFTGFTWLIFSIFIFILYSKKLQLWYSRIPLNPALKFFIFSLIFGLITEALAIIDNVPLPPERRILFNPNPATDIYLATGYYSAFALVWSIAYFRFEFTYKSIFFIAGAFGLFFEQMGKILFSFNPFAYLYVFIVYGSFQACAAALDHRTAEHVNVWKITLVGIGVELSSFLLAALLFHILALPLTW